MLYGEIEKNTKYLFAAALKKCNNLEDAKELTQEVLVAALSYKSDVGNVRAWLSSVLNHKFYDMLRRRYKLPTVSIDMLREDSEPFADDEEDGRPDAAAVRREVAYLADKYREVIIRHYLQGEKVQDIADSMGLPKGTVLSRLSAGRAQMKKGFDEMEHYKKQSYQPQRLDISCSGKPGFRDEPWSLAADDLMKQNIMIAAYEKPVTCVQIAKALGIPAAYIEQAVSSLVRSELMATVGSRVYTDFIITTPEQKLKGLDTEIAMVDRHYEGLKTIVTSYAESIKSLPFWSAIDRDMKKKAELYFILHLFSTAIYTALQRIVPSEDEYRVRPDGGTWIAIGSVYPLDFDFGNFRFGKYCYGGERRPYIEKFLNSKSIELRVYDTQPDLNRYQHGPVEIRDDDLAKMLYILHKDIPFDATGFDPMFLQNIPHLTECEVLKTENNRPCVSVPVLSKSEYNEADRIRRETMCILADYLEPAFRGIFPQLKTEIPAHLEGRAAKFRQYSCFAVPMAMLKKAIDRNDYNPAGAVPPMILVIDEESGTVK